MDEVKKYDGAHPRAAGYQVFAEIVQNWQGWLNWWDRE
jgi:lysophospholipase L1-like esterase